MNGYSPGLTFITRAVFGIGSVCGNLFAPRKLDALAATRSSQGIVDLAKEIACVSVDEMLVPIPGARATDLSNTVEAPMRYLSQEIHSPFGDW